MFSPDISFIQMHNYPAVLTPRAYIALDIPKLNKAFCALVKALGFGLEDNYAFE